MTAADRNSVTTLLPRTVTAPVPAGTRVIAVTSPPRAATGSYNDGYTDNV